ncbi:MAG TPA: CotH kinase family protein [Saprospiraceae bacterium]|nr:CotH kinase family protein [Saprospiraceae bacterium]
MTRILVLYFLSFFFLPIILQGQTFYGGGGAVPTDGSPIEFDIDVNGLPDKIDTSFGLETVCLNASHSWIADLRISLRSPNGTQTILIDNVGGDQDSFKNTCLDASAAISIYNGGFPYTGTYKPIGQMGNFNDGQNPNGKWKLIVMDTYAFVDDGNIIDWQISFGNKPGKPFIFTESKLPIINFYTDGNILQDEPAKKIRMEVIDNGPGNLNHPTDPPNNYKGYANVEWRGQSSQGFPKKPYRVETCDSLGVDSSFSILGMPAQSDWVLNASFSDKTLMRNVLAHHIFNEMGHYSSRTRFCDVFVDENYQGTYVFMEKIKRDKDRVNVSKLKSTDTTGVDITGGYIIKCDKGDDGGWKSKQESIIPGTNTYYQYVYPKLANIVPQQAAYIESYIDSLEEALFSPDFTNSYGFKYDHYLDVPSFVDNFIINELSKNIDAYRLSTYFHKKKDSDGGKLHAGPLWDFDLSFRNADFCSGADPIGWIYDQYCDYTYFPPPMFFYKMFGDSSFWNAVKCRWVELRAGFLSETALDNYIDSQRDSVYEAAKKNFEVWPILGVYVWPNANPIATTYDGEISDLKDWIHIRLNWLDQNIPGSDDNCITSIYNTKNGVNNYHIYPNPADNFLHIKINATTSNISLEIINIQGENMTSIATSLNEINLDVSNFPTGVYFIKFLEKDKLLDVEKIVIIR